MPAPAQAAPTPLTASCEDGAYSGRFVLHYDTAAGLHRIQDGRGGSGPYIADTGTMRVRIFYRKATAEHEVYNGTRSGLSAGFGHEVDIPEGTRVPANGTAFVQVAFTGGGSGCTAVGRFR